MPVDTLDTTPVQCWLCDGEGSRLNLLHDLVECERCAGEGTLPRWKDTP